jgi:hypothetical protein
MDFVFGTTDEEQSESEKNVAMPIHHSTPASFSANGLA